MRYRGFTLIELLIVVAIIAILAAIAVPNFLEAQTRAKVSRTTADMRTLDLAIETYQIDHNRTPTTLTGYPGGLLGGPSLVSGNLSGIGYCSYRFRRLTTPVAYINSVFPDVFGLSGKVKNAESGGYDSFDYMDDMFGPDYYKTHLQQAPASQRRGGLTSGAKWRLSSCGPDNWQGFGGSTVAAGHDASWRGVDYDASNGTVSTGDIVRVGGRGTVPAAWRPAIERPALKYNIANL